jgi:hypothetical protein
MAKDYGDIPCVNLDGQIHITKSGTKCICGRGWKCGFWNPDRPELKYNIIWREFDAVTCEKCKELYC